MKMHIGVDKATGIIHTVITTPANVNDVTKADELRRPDDWEVIGDKQAPNLVHQKTFEILIFPRLFTDGIYSPTDCHKQRHMEQINHIGKHSQIAIFHCRKTPPLFVKNYNMPYDN